MTKDIVYVGIDIAKVRNDVRVELSDGKVRVNSGRNSSIFERNHPNRTASLPEWASL